MKKIVILLILSIVAFFIGNFLGFLLTKNIENNKYITLQREYINKGNECDSLKDLLHVFELDLEQKIAALNYFGYNELDTFEMCPELVESLKYIRIHIGAKKEAECSE